MIGIYMIENTINGKRYIGQSWDIEKRWQGEIAGQCNKHLQNAFIKYGIGNFSFGVLHELKEGPFTQKYLDKLEQLEIARYSTMNDKHGYNKRSGGARGKHCEATKELIGLKSSQKHMSPEARKRISVTRIRKPVRCVDTGITYESVEAAGRFINKKACEITKAIRFNYKTGGYHWEYV